MTVNQEERLRTLYSLEKFYEFENSQWVSKGLYEEFCAHYPKTIGIERRSRPPSWDSLVSACEAMTGDPHGVNEIYRSIIAYQATRRAIYEYLNNGISEISVEDTKSVPAGAYNYQAHVDSRNFGNIMTFMDKQIACPPSGSRNMFSFVKSYPFLQEEKECLNSLPAFIRKLSDATQIFRGINSKITTAMVRGLGDFYLTTGYSSISIDLYEKLRPSYDSEKLAEEVYSRGRLRGMIEFFRFAAASYLVDPTGGKKKTPRGQDAETYNIITKLKTDNSFMKNIIDSLYARGSVPEDIYNEMIHRTRPSQTDLLVHFRSRLSSHFGIKLNQQDAEGINATIHKIKTIAWSKSTRSPYIKIKIRDTIVYAVLTKDRKGEYVLTTAYTEAMFLKDADTSPPEGDADEFLRNRKSAS